MSRLPLRSLTVITHRCSHKKILRLELFSFNSHSHFFLFTQRHLHLSHKILATQRLSTLFVLCLVQFIFWMLPLFFWFRVSPCQISFLDFFRVISFLLFSSPYANLHIGPFSISLCRLEVPFCKSRAKNMIFPHIRPLPILQHAYTQVAPLQPAYIEICAQN
jgi:hypothetical protein